jgi:hypothetical protein
MNLETPKKFQMLVDQAQQVALNFLRPISRKYDKAEHSYPKELDMLASLLDGMNDGAPESAGASTAGKRGARKQTKVSAMAPICRQRWASSKCAMAIPACCCPCLAKAG